MNTRFQKRLILLGIGALLVCSAQVVATQVVATEVVAGEKKPANSSKAQSSQTKSSGNGFQLTLSTVPYSSDPDSDYVKIYCAPDKSHGKKNK